MMMDPDMIGAIKIKDGLFIGDELAASVRPSRIAHNASLGPRVRGREQSHSCDQLRRNTDTQPLGAYRRGLPHVLLA